MQVLLQLKLVKSSVATVAHKGALPLLSDDEDIDAQKLKQVQQQCHIVANEGMVWKQKYEQLGGSMEQEAAKLRLKEDELRASQIRDRAVVKEWNDKLEQGWAELQQQQQ